MTTNVIARFWRLLAAPTADFGTGASLGFFGRLWLLPRDAPPPPPMALSAAATLAVVGVAFEVARIRSIARWRAAWDRYAELELARATIVVEPVRQQVRGR